jgi:hypothetical protein
MMQMYPDEFRDAILNGGTIGRQPQVTATAAD